MFLRIFFLLISASCLVNGGYTVSGRMSTFGGPNDSGVSASEGLAIYNSYSQRPGLFLKAQPRGTSGLARRLNPDVYYIATRWDYSTTSKNFLRRIQVTVTNPTNGRSAYAWPVDFGPGTRTNRVADLSPGLARYLGVGTDDTVQVYVPTP